jgi:YgiT-type zinc finger domain-containing protein
MKCFICNQAETALGLTSVLLERGHLSLTVTNVPARICPNCGEAYADETAPGRGNGQGRGESGCVRVRAELINCRKPMV